MPIRLHKGQRPKYRMIHATNHADGCVLMYENICKRWEVLDDMQTGGQINFFNTSVDDDFIDLSTVQERLREHLQQYNTYTSLNVVLADFFTLNGVVCKKADIIKMIQDLEESGGILVSRNPATTTNGKARRYYTESSKQHVQIRRKP